VLCEPRFSRAELLDGGKWGIEGLIIEAPDDLRIGHRFDYCEQAVRWAESIRGDMERWTSTGLAAAIRHDVSLVPPEAQDAQAKKPSLDEVLP
jgi:hypothetical protein